MLENFEISENYMYRKTLLGMEYYTQIFDHEQLDDDEYLDRLVRFVQQQGLIDSIYVSSPSTYAALQSLEQGRTLKSKKKRNLILSLSKFISRAICRPTPFGLFAGVGISRFGKTGGAGEHVVWATPDYSLIYRLIGLFHGDTDVRNELRLSVNNTSYIDHHRLVISYQTLFAADQEERSTENISILKTPVIDFIMKILDKEQQTFLQLMQAIKDAFGVDDTISTDFLQQLIEQGFLVSEMIPNPRDSAPLAHLIRTLKLLATPKAAYYSDILERVGQAIQDITVAAVKREGIEAVRKLVQLILPDYQGDLVKIDVRLNQVNEILLSDSDRQSLAQIASILSMLSTYRKEDTLSDYRQQFTEKYGVYEEVPLLQLFSKTLGLGKPEEYKSHYQNGDKYRHKDEGRFRQLKALIAEWQTEALVNHSDIVLDEVKIQQLSELSLENVHVSFDLYYSCMENEQGEVTFYLNNRAGSLEACQSFGRFAYMFDKDSRDEIFNFVRNPKDQKAGESAAEISFYPFSPKITNIMTAGPTPDQSMDMATFPENRKLDVSQLLVGVEDSGYFYLKHRETGELVFPKLSSMYNTELAPYLIRFLNDINLQYQTGWSHLEEYLYDSSFTPRVTYKNIIICPKKWTLYADKQLQSEEQFLSFLEDWIIKYNIPRYVYLVELDNKLLLDLDRHHHRKLLHKEYTRNPEGKAAVIMETEKELFASANRYMEECVFFCKSPMFQYLPIDRLSAQATDKSLNKVLSSSVNAVYYPGSDWISLQVYYNQEMLTDLLGSAFKTFMDNSAEYFIDQVFFVQYADKEPHIRLRCKMSGSVEHQRFTALNYVFDFLNTVTSSGLVSSYSVVPYRPEILRYGGAAFIEQAERLFAIDSYLVSGYYAGKRSINATDQMLFCCTGLFEVVNCAYPLAEDQLKAMAAIIDPKKFRQEYREHKEALFQRIQQTRSISLPASDTGDRLRQYAAYFTAIREADDRTNYYDDIMFSIMHMFCNRVFGLDREKEELALHLCYYSLEDYLQVSKYHVAY
ncbi:lantibiotic dehydratase [Paenibacillus sp. FSL M8-0228]|uniref:lantibiotic dehydratase n=1 Tax=Paenibacillus TaxID=44249 RepID=UPI00083E159D|nr:MULTISPECIES: lantibiotic dehydratase [Paenibacillus]MBO3283338.1 lantibiotic dehydratase [Paenibacillus polymyxa]MBP1311644.1 thiopeptide-type bacteriocin biosynthesis protein [Paenibacillus sp. 1182]ODB49870.1 hypothetical protein A7311_09590 [Paenibacillus polymyxa]